MISFASRRATAIACRPVRPRQFALAARCFGVRQTLLDPGPSVGQHLGDGLGAKARNRAKNRMKFAAATMIQNRLIGQAAGRRFLGRQSDPLDRTRR